MNEGMDGEINKKHLIYLINLRDIEYFYSGLIDRQNKYTVGLRGLSFVLCCCWYCFVGGGGGGLGCFCFFVFCFISFLLCGFFKTKQQQKHKM